ncbi:hypothetical protein KCU81_g66, partial [Aureobasidium melanogenum]
MTLILRVRFARSSRRILFASSTSALDGGLFSSFSSLIGTTLREVSIVRGAGCAGDGFSQPRCLALSSSKQNSIEGSLGSG